MTLNQFKDKYGSLRIAANALRIPHTTFAGWIKSKVVRKIIYNSAGEPECWRKE